ncbi:amidohydrolase [Streptomyces sp. NBC_00257]|uniref:amidohydrolase n=1 Tax=unclassified Streptomyces TaxID=2593676 RepID=UPI00224D71DD|nr:MULTISPECIES: amidohydrolase [unclassified Streptomyces]MCX5433390.1 amidohydrolase [Streptomyces sp. NBC_00062]
MRLDAVFHNGRFATLDPDRPEAHAIGVLGGRIAALDEELAGCTADTVVDLGGAHAVPGFNDAHHHLSLVGKGRRELDVSYTAAPTLDALYRAVAERAATLPADAWVLGAGYDQNKTGAHPNAEALDRAAGGRPVWLVHTSHHMAVAGTAAFARAGFTDLAAVPDVPGGHVVRDASGRAEGLLQETAMQLVERVLRPEPAAEWTANIAEGARAALAVGLTSVTEPGIGVVDGIGNGPADLDAYLRVRESGRLGVRMTLMPYITALRDCGVFEPDTTWYGLDLGLRTGFGDEWLRIGPTKMMSDGSLIGRSAAMCCDYHDTPGNSGLLQHEPEQIRRYIVEAHRCGWQIATHAIGDAALDVVLDAYEEAQRLRPRADARHRVEHAAVTSDAQVARIAALGLIPVPQGRFLSEIGDGLLAALGPERSRLAYRMRSFLDAGLVLPGSSDAPVVASDPLLSIHDMVNRTTASGAPIGPHEAVTAREALTAYTIGSAHAVHEEHLKGTLARGMLADFAVLSDDLLGVAPERITRLTVGATVVGGWVAHDTGALKVS